MDAELEDEHEFELVMANIVRLLKHQQAILAPKPEVHLPRIRTNPCFNVKHIYVSP